MNKAFWIHLNTRTEHHVIESMHTLQVFPSCRVPSVHGDQMDQLLKCESDDLFLGDASVTALLVKHSVCVCVDKLLISVMPWRIQSWHHYGHTNPGNSVSWVMSSSSVGLNWRDHTAPRWQFPCNDWLTQTCVSCSSKDASEGRQSQRQTPHQQSIATGKVCPAMG